MPNIWKIRENEIVSTIVGLDAIPMLSIVRTYDILSILEISIK